ncbi:MAG: hypothetical protein R3B09_32015 [Nannocystaceae bacterium]
MSALDPEIVALVAALDEESPQARDVAAARLVALGWPAAPVLLGLPSATASGRARCSFTLVGVVYSAQSRWVRGEAPLHDLRLAGRLGDLGPELALWLRRAVTIDPALVDTEVDVDVVRATTLEVLDRLAAAAGASWEQDVFGGLRLSSPLDPPAPTAYAGPLRVRATRLACTRTTDFSRVECEACLTLAVRLERPLAPILPLNLSVLRAHDDLDTELNATVSTLEADEHDASFAVRLTGLHPEARTLKALDLRITGVFPEDVEVLTWTRPEPGARLQSALCELEVTHVEGDGLGLVARPTAEAATIPPETFGRLVDAALLGAAGSDEELAAVECWRAAGSDAVHWRARWSRLDPRRLDRLQLYVARALFVSPTALSLRGLALP